MAIVLFPLFIEPTAQLRQKQSEVFLVGGAFDISLQTALHRKLPVDVDPIEQTGVRSEEDVNDRPGEATSRLRGCRARE